MPQPYSADLRERVLAAYEQGEGSQVAIAHRFRVCPSTVCNWIRQARQEGRRCPKPHRGGPAGWTCSVKATAGEWAGALEAGLAFWV